MCTYAQMRYFFTLGHTLWQVSAARLHAPVIYECEVLQYVDRVRNTPGFSRFTTEVLSSRSRRSLELGGVAPGLEPMLIGEVSERPLPVMRPSLAALDYQFGNKALFTQSAAGSRSLLSQSNKALTSYARACIQDRKSS